MLTSRGEVAFAYNPQMTQRLIKDFTKVVAIDVPFFTVQDELLYFLVEHDVTHFRIPASKTRDGLDHIFYFEIFVNEDLPRPRLYKYLYQKIDRSRKK